MTANRVAGIGLIAIGLLGFLLVADDIRHVGEIVGASSLVLAGCLLLAASLNAIPISSTVARSGAIGILPGMILGAGLDQMLVGVGVGLAAGIATGLLYDRRKSSTNGKAP